MKAVLVSGILFFINLFTINAQSTWEKPYIGSSSKVLYLPDGNAVYWRYGWTRDENDKNGYVIKGQFPDARYFSYNLYDDNTKSSIGSLTDVNIKPDDSKNNYTLYIVPTGTVINGKNVLYFDKTLPKLSVILRHYLPDKTINGNKNLPSIEVFDIERSTTKKAPQSVPVPKLSREDIQKYLVPLFDKFMEDPETNIEKFLSKDKSLNIEELICRQVVANAFNFYKKGSVIYAYNLSSDGTYPNKDNHYLTMPIVKTNKDDICIVKFKALSYPKSKGEYSTCDVRYFSISQGDELTYNYSTIADQQFTVNSDGYIYLVIGPEREDVKAKAKSLKMNFMPWLVDDKMLLIYRNMLPNPAIKNATNSVPKLDKTKNPGEQKGTNYIGEYSPTGFFFTIDTFIQSSKIPTF